MKAPADAARARARTIAARAAILALAALLMSGAVATASVRLTTGAIYSGKSTACVHPKPKGTSCVFSFRAGSNGYGLGFVEKRTVISSWSCRKGGGEALFGGKVAGHVRVPVLLLQPDGELLGSVGSGPNRVSASGHIAEAGTKVVLRLHLAHGHCVTPKITLIEGIIPGAAH